MNEPKKIRSREELYRRVLSTDPQEVADRQAMPVVAQLYATALVAAEVQIGALCSGNYTGEVEINRVRRAIGGSR